MGASRGTAAKSRSQGPPSDRTPAGTPSKEAQSKGVRGATHGRKGRRPSPQRRAPRTARPCPVPAVDPDGDRQTGERKRKIGASVGPATGLIHRGRGGRAILTAPALAEAEAWSGRPAQRGAAVISGPARAFV